jgi:hypothetical protein
MFLPIEIVTLSERVKVVEVGKLVEIPSFKYVRPLVSCTNKRKSILIHKISLWITMASLMMS